MKQIGGLQKGMGWNMEKKNFPHENIVYIEDIPEGKTAEDYPEDTLFVWKDHEPIDRDSDWDE